MAAILKFEKRSKALGEKMPAALREFIDAVIVPALVREYLAEKKSTNILASRNCGVAESAAKGSLRCEVPQ